MLDKLIKKLFNKRFKNIDDFNLIIQTANQKNIISTYSKQIIESALQTANLIARDVMVPKSKMTTINHNASFSDFLTIITESSHSRFPVIGDNNQVIGILLAKDLLGFTAGTKEKFNYLDYLRDVITIPENKSLESLLKFFQLKRSHLMIVIDEYSQISGLITLEDVLEQIVGEIEDEHDFEEDDIINYGNNRFLVKASTSVDDFNHYFKTNFTTNKVGTIAGILSKKFGYLPKQLEKIKIDNLNFKVLKANNRKIKLVEVITHE